MKTIFGLFSPARAIEWCIVRQEDAFRGSRPLLFMAVMCVIFHSFDHAQEVPSKRKTEGRKPPSPLCLYCLFYAHLLFSYSSLHSSPSRRQIKFITICHPIYNGAYILDIYFYLWTRASPRDTRKQLAKNSQRRQRGKIRWMIPCRCRVVSFSIAFVE